MRRSLVSAAVLLWGCASVAQEGAPAPPTVAPSAKEAVAPPVKRTPTPKRRNPPARVAPQPEPPQPPAPPPPLAQDPTPPLLPYCAPPVQPDCLNDDKTYASPAASGACQQDMDRYVRSVFAYRVCLNSEMERAVFATNQALQRFRCRVAKKTNCP